MRLSARRLSSAALGVLNPAALGVLNPAALGLLNPAALGLLGLAAVLHAHPALAGPVEVLAAVAVDPSDPQTLAVRYRNGGSGLFLSRDGGQTFELLCDSAVSAAVTRDVVSMHVLAGGSLVLGAFDSTWASASGGCGWAPVDTFGSAWTNAFAVDPLDPEVSYAMTGSGGTVNGLFRWSATTGAWQPIGVHEQIVLIDLRVAALGPTTRRFYQSAVRLSTAPIDAGGADAAAADAAAADAGTSDGSASGRATSAAARYLLRYSDDAAATWTEYGVDLDPAGVRLVGVDPTAPERIVAAVVHESDPTANDVLYYSTAAGRPGTFSKIGEVGELGGVAFSPDGRLFFGDHDVKTPGLHVVDALGSAPRALATGYRVGCLGYEPMTQRLFACQDYVFGVVEPTTGEFTALLDITRVERFVECPGEPDMASRCETQLLGAYCGITHFPKTPVCSAYAGDAGTRDASAAGSAATHPDAGTDGGIPVPRGGACACALGARDPSAARSSPATPVLTALLVVGLGAGRRRPARRRDDHPGSVLRAP